MTQLFDSFYNRHRMEKANNAKQEPLILERMRTFSLNCQKMMRQQAISESRKMFERNYEMQKTQETPSQTNELELNETVEELRAPVDELDLKIDRSRLFTGGMKEKKKTKKTRSNVVLYAKRFQVPGWLIAIPQDFGSYLVTIRPEGKRMLLFINASKVVARSKSGYTIHTFYTEYAGKSPMSTIFEAIYSELTQTYFIMDVIQWKGTYFTGQSALFRHHWLVSNLAAMSEPTESCPFRLQRIELMTNTRKTVQLLYTAKTPFQKDGLIFIHPESKYLHRSNESVLCWKDSLISEFPIDTEDDGKTVGLQIKGVGMLAKNRGLYTLDRHKLWQFSEMEELEAIGECIRFAFTAIQVGTQQEPTMQEEQQQLTVKLEGFRIVSKSGYKKSIPDPLSKLLYQYQVRYNPITIEQILASLQ